MGRTATWTSRPLTSGIRAGEKLFNSMVLSSVDPGNRKSFSSKSCTVTDEVMVLDDAMRTHVWMGVPPCCTRC